MTDELGLQQCSTPDGIKFGVFGRPPKCPAPTAFVLCSCTIQDALRDRFAGACARILANHGFMPVSIDIPCHGADRRVGEPEGLEGWCDRAVRADNFVEDSNRRLSSVLDHLIETGQSDPSRIVTCGTSRGGFLALHFAAHDARVRCTAAFAPVTDLLVLREFRREAGNPLIESLALQRQVERLAGHPAWVVIGDQDQRVGTDDAISFVRLLTAASVRQGKMSHVELHVVCEPRGHTLPDRVSAAAADWIVCQLP